MEHFDIIIIGAGVQGLSTAYNLALNGAKSVLVLETQMRSGLGSSGRSAAMLMKSRENEPKIRLSLYSYARFMNFADEYDEQLDFRKIGFISAVKANLAVRYEEEHLLRVSLGVPSEKLTPQEIARMCPGIFVDDLAFGIYCPDDGQIDPFQIMNAYRRKGEQLGVQYRFNSAATNIALQSNKVVGVESTSGTLSCEVVVNAGGADAKKIGEWLGISLPIANRRRSLYQCETDHQEFNSGPMVEDAELEWYYRPDGNGKILIGMGLEPENDALNGPNLDYLPQVREAAKVRAPKLAQFKLTGGSSGIRPKTPDILPIIGPYDGIDGLFLNCGWGGEGIMHSPAGGAITADWILNSNKVDINKQQFQANRFAIKH
jgi:sarcosine oxidase subunit beta